VKSLRSFTGGEALITAGKQNAKSNVLVVLGLIDCVAMLV